MAQGGWFEVSRLEFDFYSTTDKDEKAELISEGIKKYMRKYASSTSYEISSKIDNVFSSDVKVMVEFSKSISLNTVNKLLSKMALGKIHRIIYMPLEEKVDVSVMGWNYEKLLEFPVAFCIKLLQINKKHDNIYTYEKQK